MEIPPCFSNEFEGNKVYKLKKSLYGLKQSPRAWFDRLTKVLKNQGYQQRQSDHTMFFKQAGNGIKTVLIVYAEDIILIGDNVSELERLEIILAKEFEVKDLGQ